MLRRAIDSLSTWKERDPSTNLHGAYIKGLQHLKKKMDSHGKRFTRGMLFLLTDGTDQAARKTMREALGFRGLWKLPGRRGHRLVRGYRGPVLAQPGKYMVAMIGVKEGELDEKALKQLADPGLYIGLRGWKYRESKKINRLVDYLDKLGRSFHVLSYCSPKRLGQHKVQIEVSRDAARTVAPAEGGRIEATFNANGFAPGCDADRIIQQYAECGVTGGRTCQPGYECKKDEEGKSEYRCISLADKAAAKRERMRAERRMLSSWRHRQRRLDSAFRGCQSTQASRKRLWAAYQPLQKEYIQSDCGFRFMAEGGLSLVPSPQGVAGALLLGWSFRRWVEIHAGIGFPATLLLQVRVKPYSWRWLDLMIIPRIGVGLRKEPWTFEAELLLGLRARIGRHFAIYLQLGPGYAQSQWGPVQEKGFVFPGWLGAELRL